MVISVSSNFFQGRWARNWRGFVLGLLGALVHMLVYTKRSGEIFIPPLPFICGASMTVLLCIIPLFFVRANTIMFRLAGQVMSSLIVLAAFMISYYGFLCISNYYIRWILGIAVMLVLFILFNIADLIVLTAKGEERLAMNKKAALALCSLGSLGGIVYTTAFPFL